MTDQNTDALRCADWCEEHSSGAYRTSAEAAAHIRRLVAENELLQHYRRVYCEIGAILACIGEAPPPSDDDQITVRRLKWLIKSHEDHVDSCEAKADRIDRLGESVARLVAENEAHLAAMRQALEALELELMHGPLIAECHAAISALKARLGPTCGRIFNGCACPMPKGSNCPDCGPAVHDFPEGS